MNPGIGVLLVSIAAIDPFFWWRNGPQEVSLWRVLLAGVLSGFGFTMMSFEVNGPISWLGVPAGIAISAAIYLWLRWKTSDRQAAKEQQAKTMAVLLRDRVGARRFDRLIALGSAAIVIATIAEVFVRIAQDWRDPTWPRIAMGALIVSGAAILLILALLGRERRAIKANGPLEQQVAAIERRGVSGGRD
jgi:hypothetical protein